MNVTAVTDREAMTADGRTMERRDTGTSSLLRLPSDQDASGRTLGDEEIDRVVAVLRSGTLTSTKGTQVAELEARVAELYGVEHAIACSSGTAAVHAAVTAIDPAPGDEIVTTPITDMGAITPLLYQGAVPVFADVDPATGNVTASTVEAVLSERTRAVIVTHLFGIPAEVHAIREVARRRNIPVIEDCAQAYLTRERGRLVGTVGDIGCFSLQQGKHITTGEGGFVITSDAALARRMRLFVNKAWPYGEPGPDHEFLALNSRLSELAGAVACAQLSKLEGVVDARIARAEQLTARLRAVPDLRPPEPAPEDVATYWKYPVLVDGAVVPGGPRAVAEILEVGGIASAPRYIQKPAFRCAVLADQVTFGGSRWPFTLARAEAVDYSAERFPGSFAYLDQVLVLPWNERYTEEHVHVIASALTDAVETLAGGAR